MLSGRGWELGVGLWEGGDPREDAPGIGRWSLTVEPREGGRAAAGKIGAAAFDMDCVGAGLEVQGVKGAIAEDRLVVSARESGGGLVGDPHPLAIKHKAIREAKRSAG